MSLLAALTVIPMLAPVPAEAKARIEGVHRKIGAIVVAKDSPAMQRLAFEAFTPGFVWKRFNGREMNFLDTWGSIEADARAEREGRGDGPLRYNTVLANWKLDGDTITVEATHHVVGEWLQGNRRLPVRYRNLVRERWVRSDGEWKADRFDDVWMIGEMDKKPFSFKPGQAPRR